MAQAESPVQTRDRRPARLASAIGSRWAGTAALGVLTLLAPSLRLAHGRINSVKRAAARGNPYAARDSIHHTPRLVPTCHGGEIEIMPPSLAGRPFIEPPEMMYQLARASADRLALYGRRTDGTYTPWALSNEFRNSDPVCAIVRNDYSLYLALNSLHLDSRLFQGSHMDPRMWQRVVLPLLEAATGKHAGAVRLGWSPSAWREIDASGLSIPRFFSWEVGSVAETRTMETVPSTGDLGRWAVQTMRFLGFYADLPDAAVPHQIASGHVNWSIRRTDLERLGGEARTRIFEALRGHWGDTCDGYLVNLCDRVVSRLDLRSGSGASTVELPADVARGAAQELDSWMDRFPVGLLTRRQYLDHRTGADGIAYVGESSLSPNEDPHFPPADKFLPMGLRSDRPSDRPSRGYHYPRLEARAATSFAAGMKWLPPTDSNGGFDWRAFVRQTPRGVRGVVGDSAGLTRFLSSGRGAIAEPMSALVTEVQAIVEAGFREHADRARDHGVTPLMWPPDQMLALHFLPATPWLDHPAVKASLTKLNRTPRRATRRRYREAVARYRRRIEDLALARGDHDRSYTPDWTGLRANSAWSIDNPVARGTEGADGRLLEVLRAEAIRFVAESGIGALMPHGK